MAKKQIILTGLKLFKIAKQNLGSLIVNFTFELLAAGIIVSAVLHINAEYHDQQWKIYIFKPLTMVLIITMGLNLLPEDIGWYHLALLVGLLFLSAETWP